MVFRSLFHVFPDFLKAINTDDAKFVPVLTTLVPFMVVLVVGLLIVLGTGRLITKRAYNRLCTSLFAATYVGYVKELAHSESSGHNRLHRNPSHFSRQSVRVRRKRSRGREAKQRLAIRALIAGCILGTCLPYGAYVHQQRTNLVNAARPILDELLKNSENIDLEAQKIQADTKAADNEHEEIQRDLARAKSGHATAAEIAALPTRVDHNSTELKSILSRQHSLIQELTHEKELQFKMDSYSKQISQIDSRVLWQVAEAIGLLGLLLMINGACFAFVNSLAMQKPAAFVPTIGTEASCTKQASSNN